VHILYLHLGLKKQPESVESTSEDEDEVEKHKVKWFKMLRITDVALPEFCNYLCYVFVSRRIKLYNVNSESFWNENYPRRMVDGPCLDVLRFCQDIFLEDYT